jgi:hypothetical protein
VACAVSVGVGVNVAVFVGDGGGGVGLGVDVGVETGVGVGVWVAVAVGLGVGGGCVGVAVAVGAAIGVRVSVGKGVEVEVLLAVSSGDGSMAISGAGLATISQADTPSDSAINPTNNLTQFTVPLTSISHLPSTENAPERNACRPSMTDRPYVTPQNRHFYFPVFTAFASRPPRAASLPTELSGPRRKGLLPTRPEPTVDCIERSPCVPRQGRKRL